MKGDHCLFGISSEAKELLSKKVQDLPGVDLAIVLV